MKVFVNRYVKGSSQVYACLIDVSKVFDTVDHYVLYKKLLDNALDVGSICLLILITYASTQTTCNYSFWSKFSGS